MTSPDLTSESPTQAGAIRDAEEVLHPQDSRVIRDVHGNPLPGTDDPGEDTVARSGGAAGTD